MFGGSSCIRVHNTLYLILCTFFYSFAQDDEPPIYGTYRLNIKGSTTIPHLLTSKGIRKSFTGVYGFTFSPCVDLYKGLYVGLDYELGAFTTAANKIAKLNYREPVMQNNNLGFVIGYDYYPSETTLWSFAVEAGNTWVNYKDLTPGTAFDSLNTVHSFSALYIKPEIAVYLFIEKNFAIGFDLSYHLVSRTFDPDMADLRSYRDYSANELKGPISYLNVGFGLYVGLTKKKK